MFYSVSLFSQAPLARGSRALPSVLLLLLLLLLFLLAIIIAAAAAAAVAELPMLCQGNRIVCVFFFGNTCSMLSAVRLHVIFLGNRAMYGKFTDVIQKIYKMLKNLFSQENK